MNDKSGRLHFILHDWYGYISFLSHLPFHFWHKQEVCSIVLRGFILCSEPCGYCYDRGYYCMKCKRCWEAENKRLREIHL